MSKTQDELRAEAAALLWEAQSKSRRGVQDALALGRLAAALEDIGREKRENSLVGRLSPGLSKYAT